LKASLRINSLPTAREFNAEVSKNNC